MHHFFSIAVSLLAVIGSSSGGYLGFVSVTNGMPWGNLVNQVMCPSGLFAAGFSLRVERPINGDDTALNAIRLHCTNWAPGSAWNQIEAHSGFWGDWTAVKTCPNNGYLTAFQMRVENFQLADDDTAANNIRFRCSDGTVLEGDGTTWGGWGDWSPTCAGKGICGISTQTQADQRGGDDTALNNAQMLCCN